MELLTLCADAQSRGQRLDVWLSEQLDSVTRSGAQRLIGTGAVTVNGEQVCKSVRLRGTETVTVTLPDPEPLCAVPQNIPLDIVYEDSDVIVVNKPAGMVVHPAPGHPDGTLVNALLYHCGGTLSGINGALRPGIVHRIDRDTTGLIIAAKNDMAHQNLAAQLQAHTLSRIYRCLTTGVPHGDAGTIDAPIGRSVRDRKKMAIVADGRPAVTHWRVVERLRGCADVECRLETGRTHQIRVHMASIGHPVLGDPVYGTPCPGLTGQCLHALKLRFLHPRSGVPMECACPLPDEFVRAKASRQNHEQDCRQRPEQEEQ